MTYEDSFNSVRKRLYLRVNNLDSINNYCNDIVEANGLIDNIKNQLSYFEGSWKEGFVNNLNQLQSNIRNFRDTISKVNDILDNGGYGLCYEGGGINNARKDITYVDTSSIPGSNNSWAKFKATFNTQYATVAGKSINLSGDTNGQEWYSWAEDTAQRAYNEVSGNLRDKVFQDIMNAYQSACVTSSTGLNGLLQEVTTIKSNLISAKSQMDLSKLQNSISGAGSLGAIAGGTLAGASTVSVGKMPTIKTVDYSKYGGLGGVSGINVDSNDDSYIKELEDKRRQQENEMKEEEEKRRQEEEKREKEEQEAAAERERQREAEQEAWEEEQKRQREEYEKWLKDHQSQVDPPDYQTWINNNNQDKNSFDSSNNNYDFGFNSNIITPSTSADGNVSGYSQDLGSSGFTTNSGLGFSGVASSNISNGFGNTSKTAGLAAAGLTGVGGLGLAGKSAISGMSAGSGLTGSGFANSGTSSLGSSSSSAASSSSGAKTGMMAAGGGRGAGKEKEKKVVRHGLAYIAPELEEDDFESYVKGDGAKSGGRS
ncbi:MAG: hypothetical protein LBM13_06220 [Candidatus Ancillula sp.]|jgi:hypothetical protein|nr:hypothetical protein [Candidatus Ancillula sp.]